MVGLSVLGLGFLRVGISDRVRFHKDIILGTRVSVPMRWAL